MPLLNPLRDNRLLLDIDRGIVSKASKENLNHQEASDALLLSHFYWSPLHVELSLKVSVDGAFILNRLGKHGVHLNLVHVEDLLKLLLLLILLVGGRFL